MSKQISIFLCIIIILSLLTSCAGTGDISSSVSQLEYESAVPEDVRFNGETFSILSREDNAFSDPLQFEVAADESSSDVVNQAVYERNLVVEERFGIEIKNYAIAGQYDVKDDFQTTFINSILSGAGEYDLILGQQAYMAETGIQDYFTNIYDLPYLKDNLDAEYYIQDLVDELTIDGKMYYLVSDYCLTYWDNLWVMFYNKQLAENYNIENLYDLVRNGEWTFDKLVELSRGMYNDLNGDNWPGEEDQYGFIIDIDNTPPSFFAVFDNLPTTKHDDGTVEMTVDQGKMVSILEKFISFKQSECVYYDSIHSNKIQDDNPLDIMFSGDRALFYTSVLYKARKFRSMETDFGIIPMPKWDENQTDYYTESFDHYSVIMVPIDCQNKEKAGAVIDVLSAISYSTVLPAYYDVALKNKFARDEDSAEMLDIIRENVKVNFGLFFDSLDIARSMRVLVPQDNTNYVSFYASNEKMYNRNIKKVLESYGNHE